MNVETVPAWAHQWCYYFLAIAVVSITTGLFVGIAASKKLGIALTILYLIGTLVQAATGMTLFWMCRTSLNPNSTCHA